jgi:hypothetical protein
MSRSTGGAGNAMLVLLPGMDGSGLGPHFMLQAKPAESAAQIHRLLREVV